MANQNEGIDQKLQGRLEVLPHRYQWAFALLISERLLDTLFPYLPEYWRECAREMVDEAFVIASNENYDNNKLEHICAKLRGEGIGLESNPVVEKIITCIDVASQMSDKSERIDTFIAAFNTLIDELENRTKRPQAEADAIANEYAFIVSCYDALEYTYAERTPLTKEALTPRLKIPPTSLFGLPAH